MKKTLVAIAAGLFAISTGSLADNSFNDRARVLSAKPIYETVSVNNPEQRCWNERVYHRTPGGSQSYTPTIAGAILGGAVGNQFGKGRGKDAMTVAGVILGASVGNDLGKHPDERSYATTERRCELVDHYQERRELVGYEVKYRYNGKIFWTQTDNHPGDTLPVRVSLEPVVERYSYNSRYDGGYDD